jgi:excisionase family DNA binding protein
MPRSLPAEASAPDLVLTITEAATLLKVSSRSIRRLIDRGDLTVARFGRSVRITRRSIDRLIG